MAEDKNRNMNRDQDTNRQGGQGNTGGQGNMGGRQGSNQGGQDKNISAGSQGSTDQNKKKNNW